MRHVFILNPAAGKNKKALDLIPRIEQVCQNHNLDFTVYTTTHPRHATELSQYEAQKGDAVRLYACGGDGTLLEVASGIGDAANAELVCVPCGSANDFIRFFPDSERFSNLEALVLGTARRIDAILCNGKLSLNVCSIGMDADVANRQKRYKHLPFVSGPMAYNLAVAQTFFSPFGKYLHVIMETENGKVERVGKYLFALAANGQYYGGGYHGSPQSRPDDGMLDFVLVATKNHFNVFPFLKRYKSGNHLGTAGVESFRGTKMTVYAQKPTVCNVDGECFADTQVTFELLPGALSFVFPNEMLKNCEISEKYQITT